MTSAPSSGKKRIVLIAGGIVAALILKLGVFFAFIGMLPAIVAYETDHTKLKFVFSTVFAFNFAGVFPDLMQVFIGGGTFEIIKIKLLDPYVWLSMYGSAALGWSLIWLSPVIASAILESVYTARILHLESLQKKSEQEWGTEIKGIAGSEKKTG